jgi:hypothetical protein
MRLAMKHPAAVATVMLSLGLVAPASAATADPHASCAGTVYASIAGQPGARAEIQFLYVFPDAAAYGVPPGALQSEFSQSHQPLEEC